MHVTFAEMVPDDRGPILAIFNHYVETTFAAYPENPMPGAFYDKLLEMCRGYPNATVRTETREVVGFGMLRPYSPMATFSRTAEITYFLREDCTGNGIGARLLEYLLGRGRAQGIRQILASVSSRNEGSLRFHERHGFVERGRLREVGFKLGEPFDVVYLQRSL